MPAQVAEETINDFVTTLGYTAIPLEVRPQVFLRDGVKRPIFALPAVADGMPPLKDEPKAYEEDFVIDWSVGFVRLAEDNARGASGAAFDVEANARLGVLIATLGPAEADGEWRSKQR
jgi:hypothetical protein